MSRTHHLFLLPLFALCCFSTPVFAAATPPAAGSGDIVVDTTVTTPAAMAAQHQIVISFTSTAPHNLFLHGQPVLVTAHLVNHDKAQDVTITVRVTSAMGSVLSNDVFPRSLKEQESVDLPIPIGDEKTALPNGIYQVMVIAGMSYSTTDVGVWNGPLDKGYGGFGISYDGPLNTDRTLADLDLFKLAGINWIRFPLQGWTPQGEAIPPEADTYKQFIREASDRDFNLLAAFTPHVSVDPSINSVQANKEYVESLLAAAGMFNYKVKNWELCCVKPAPFPDDLKGITYAETGPAREALRRYDKTLHAIFPLDDPLADNAMRLFFYNLPPKEDIIGINYNFVGIPENGKAIPKTPVVSMPDIENNATKTIKRQPPIWVTEYGFDPQKGERLPSAAYQAAMISRAIILDKVAGIQRTFWRQDPDSQYDLPFTCDDGSAQPSLLALRTTLQELNGVTAISPIVVSEDQEIHAFLLQYGGARKHQKPMNVHYAMVAWSELPTSRTALVARTSATQITMSDLWGNTVDLQPTYNMAIFQIDEFPRFFDLGKVAPSEIRSARGSITFTDKIKVLHPDGDNTITFVLQNNQQIFDGSIFGGSALPCLAERR